MRTNPISYYSEKAKGNYNVSRVLHNAGTGDARMLAMLGDKTYYYDYSDKKLKGYKTGKGDEIIRYDFQTYGDKLYVVYVDDESGENMRIMDVMELEK